MKECTKDECGMRRFGGQKSADVGVAMTESGAFVECRKGETLQLSSFITGPVYRELLVK